MRFGLASQAVGFAILVVMALTLQAWLVFVAVVFTAVGNALVIPTSTSLSSQSVGPLEQGRAQGGNQAVQALGRVVGPAWVSLVLGLSAAAYVVPYLTMLMAALLALGVLGLALPALRTARETAQPVRS
jgi:MFS family permease